MGSHTIFNFLLSGENGINFSLYLLQNMLSFSLKQKKLFNCKNVISLLKKEEHLVMGLSSNANTVKVTKMIYDSVYPA